MNVARERRPAVPGRAERHPLTGLTRIGMHRVVRGDQLGHVDQISGSRLLPRTRINHAVILARTALFRVEGQRLRGKPQLTTQVGTRQVRG